MLRYSIGSPGRNLGGTSAVSLFGMRCVHAGTQDGSVIDGAARRRGELSTKALPVFGRAGFLVKMGPVVIHGPAVKRVVPFVAGVDLCKRRSSAMRHITLVRERKVTKRPLEWSSSTSRLAHRSCTTA